MKNSLPVERAEALITFRWIGTRAKRILRAMDRPHQRDLSRARPRAVESWLRRQSLVVVSINQQPVTLSSPKTAS